MQTSDTPKSIGLFEATSQFEAFLTASEADNQTPANQAEASNAETAEEEVEAQQADEADDETPPSDTADDADSDELEEADELTDDEADDEEGADAEDATAKDEETDGADIMERLFTVKIDGKEEQVPLKEALLGYQRTADYTRSKMALAEERRAFEPEREAIKAERAQYAQLLPVLQEQIETGLTAEPDWDALIESDPTEYVRQQHAFAAQRERLAIVKAERERLAALEAEEQRKSIVEAVQKSAVELAKAMPQWKNPERWQQDRAKLLEYGQKAGFSSEELNQTYDHRALLSLWKAMRYDEIMAKRPKPQPKGPKAVASGSKAAQPTRTASDITRDKQRLAKTGSVRDAASLFERLL